ncbi:hypothetical protein AB6A40_007478 [Gnathostoma spinigerum]|uniref:Translation initiation factor eIF2B subunit delta n=1 Tax=Gnathostoma spinigerum TaxID=75299 RepID=A0ABD6ERH0_9BILA
MTPEVPVATAKAQSVRRYVSNANIFSSFLELSARCEQGRYNGIDAICVAFIDAFSEYLEHGYKANADREISHDLDQAIQPQFSYLTENGSRSFPLALGNLITQLKKEISQLPNGISEIEAKRTILEWLDEFISQNFDLAIKAISLCCKPKMDSALYVLTYSWCPVVEQILLDAYESEPKLHVCILDSVVDHRGAILAKSLCARGRECTYGMLSAVGYVIKQCRLLLLGCSAILSNGDVVADRGSSQIALAASAANVPVLVAAQTFKFVDKVQSFARGKRDVNALMLSSLETIPADLITAIITELRILPPSSAPAVLKAKQLAVD